tara:strand:+ start:3205 stop:4056 length:852 start_codon:yes stop_codon:yes gene_type:complete
MKYTYSGGRKTGKYQLRNIFLDNDKSTVCFCGGIPPVYVAMMTPDYKWDWYWENLDGELVHDTYQDTKPQQGDEWRLQHGYHGELWFYRKTEGRYSIKKYLKRRPELRVQKYPAGDFYKCFEYALERDLIVNPIVMLGYVGDSGSEKFAKIIRDKTPNMKNIPIDYVISELNKRKNYIAHKSDIKLMAYNIFCGEGRPPYINETQYVEKVTKIIDDNLKFEKVLAELFTYYGIDYSWFDLDKDNYNLFGVSKIPDRYVSSNTFRDYPTSKNKIDQWVDDYMNR